ELRQLLGVKAPPEKVVARPDLPRALTVRARAPGAPPRFASDSATPLYWPLADGGFLTRGQVGPGDPAESHPGIDIAVPTGTAVRAAAAGVVAQAGTDPAYGLFVLLRHTAGYETMYGHASRLVVREGDSVVAGQVIALSGRYGGASAPTSASRSRRRAWCTATSRPSACSCRRAARSTGWCGWARPPWSPRRWRRRARRGLTKQQQISTRQRFPHVDCLSRYHI